MWLYLFITLCVLCLIHVLFNYNERARMLMKIPGPELDFIVGNGLKVIQSPVELMKLGREYSRKYNGIFRFWVYPFGAVMIYNPDDIEIIISSTKYNDKSVVYNILHSWLREGLLISNGTKWRERRKILTPAFHFNILRQFGEIFKENSQRLVQSLKITVGEPIDIMPVISEFTLNSICETAMGTQLTEDKSGAARTYKDAIYALGRLFVQRFVKVYLFLDSVYNLTSLGKQQKLLLKTLHNFTAKVIEKRRQYVNECECNTAEDKTLDDDFVYNGKKKTAMLDLLLNAEKKGLIDKQGIQEEVDTFMFEGHDTTASGLTFCLMLLANHTDIQNKIVAELEEIFGGSERCVKMDDLPKMKYLECCIKESMRLYPPVHFISRAINNTTVLSNYTIPPNVLCHISIYDLHHSPKLYEDPEKFDPDRFLPENSAGRHPYAYLPFSAGPRNCIGQKFAMMEMKIVLAGVLRHFVLEPVTRPSDLVLTADLVLRNDGPVRVKFVKRDID